MDPKDLVKVWDAPDHSRLTPKQISIRLPILVAAKISALYEIYPRSSKSKIIGDLLATAIDEVEQALPSKKGKVIYEDAPREVDPESDQKAYHEDIGLRGKFWKLTEKYLRELEKEAGIKDPMPIPEVYVEEEMTYDNGTGG